MNNRTPILAVALGAVVGIYLLVTVVRSFYLDPRRQLVADIAALETQQNKLLLEQAGLGNFKELWQTQTSHTLSADPQTAHDRFRDDVTRLAKKHSLVGGHSIGERNALENKKGSQRGFIELPIAFSCTGTLKNLEGFLLELYQLGYAVSVDKLNLTPSPVDQGLTGAKKKDAAPRSPDGPELKITMDLATLVLPTLPQVRSVTLLPPQRPAGTSGPSTGAAATQEAGPLVSQPVGKGALAYLRDQPIEYAMITRANLFKPYVPKIDLVLEGGPKTRPVDEPRRVELRPKPDTRVVVGTTGMGGDPIAFVREADDRLSPPTELRLNEAVSDDGRGHLVLIHPKGIVIRVKPKDAAQPPRNYFVALGSKMSDRVELSGSARIEYADVEYQLKRVLSQ